MVNKKIEKKKVFQTTNWLPIRERFNQCINSIVFKYFDKRMSPSFNGFFVKVPESGLSLRNSYQIQATIL